MTVDNKVYDGQLGATFWNCTLTGIVGTEDVRCTGGTALFESATVGSAKTVRVTNLTLSGTAAGNYVLAPATGDAEPLVVVTTTATISARPATAIFAGPTRPYDGTRSATLETCTVNHVVEDAVGCSGTAIFDTASAGAGKTVSVTNLELVGADAGNYTLTATTGTTTGSIQPRTVTPTVIVADKRFDGTTSATILSCSVNPRMGADAVACTGTAAFATASAGLGKTVTVSALTLTDAAGNYTLATTTTTTTATIRANQVPVVTNPGARTAIQGASVVLALTAVDLDGDPLTWTALNLPPGIMLTPSTGVLAGTPTTIGPYTVTISATDGWDVSQTSFTWNVVMPPAPGPTSPSAPRAPSPRTTPTFSWSAVDSATYYALSITDANTASPTVVWYTPAQAGCASGCGRLHGARRHGRCWPASSAGVCSPGIRPATVRGRPTATAVVDLVDASVPTPSLGGPSGPIATRTPTYNWTR